MLRGLHDQRQCDLPGRILPDHLQPLQVRPGHSASHPVSAGSCRQTWQWGMRSLHTDTVLQLLRHACWCRCRCNGGNPNLCTAAYVPRPTPKPTAQASRKCVKRGESLSCSPRALRGLVSVLQSPCLQSLFISKWPAGQLRH